MTGSEAAAGVSREWVLKAENDLKTAVHTLKLGAECPTDNVCFHAQQCAEKYLKALLTLRGIAFPKTHDIEELLRLLPHNLEIGLGIEHLRTLTRYATVTRYPGGYEPLTLSQARSAVTMAREIRRGVRRFLPESSRSRKGGR